MSNILKQANDNNEPGSENQNNLMTSKGGMQMPRTLYDNAYNNVGSSSISAMETLMMTVPLFLARSKLIR